jgi:23S rRNA (uracil1939-C5)-methyltransferase
LNTPEPTADRPVVIGDEFELRIDGFGDGPDAIGRVGRYVLFVPGALPGEWVKVRVEGAGRKFGRALLQEVIEASPERTEPRCRHFGSCGGCHLQHLDYAAQLRLKGDRLRKTLAHHLGREDLPIEPMAGPADPWRQRNKIALHVEPGGGRDLRHGLYALRSRELVALEECPVLQEPGLELAEKLVAAASDLAIPAWDPASGRGLLRSVVLRLCAHSGERHALFVVADSEFHQAKQLGARALALGFQGVSLNINTAPPPLLLGRRTKHLAGARRITETIGGVQYLFSPQSFFQTSTWGAGFVVDALRRTRCMCWPVGAW